MTLILYFTLTRARIRKKNSRQLRSYRACSTCAFIDYEELHFYSIILISTSILSFGHQVFIGFLQLVVIDGTSVTYKKG